MVEVYEGWFYVICFYSGTKGYLLQRGCYKKVLWFHQLFCLSCFLLFVFFIGGSAVAFSFAPYADRCQAFIVFLAPYVLLYSFTQPV